MKVKKRIIQTWTKNGQFYKDIAVQNHILKSQRYTEDEIIKQNKKNILLSV